MPRFGTHLVCVICLTGALASASACASVKPASSASAVAAARRSGLASPLRGSGPCTDCSVIPIPTEVTRALEQRISALKARGGACSQYGTVLEQSFRSGRITMRPFMWRVGSHLASGEAKPNGEMTLAREIDSLNVGVRTVDDVLWTMEHEAAHIAFDLASGSDFTEERANEHVRSCRDRPVPSAQ